MFFKSDEAHIRVLAFDTRGNLIAGSDGSGLIYRISPAGEAFVLYSAPKKEITALAVDAAGNIYAAGVGEKRVPRRRRMLHAVPQPRPPSRSRRARLRARCRLHRRRYRDHSVARIRATGGSEVYQIAPDGSPRRIWSSREDIVYALGFDQGGLLAGTGNKGRGIRHSRAGDYRPAEGQRHPGHGLHPGAQRRAVRGHQQPGQDLPLGAAPDAEGTYESDVFDAHIFSRWGRAEVRGSGAFDLYARSGNVDNPDRNWSPWKKVDLATDAELDVPPARFIQWKAVLHPGKPNPSISSVHVNYLPKNVAPVIDDVVVQVGVRYK